MNVETRLVWLGSDKHGDLAAPLHRFTKGGYSVRDLQADLARYAFLLGDDGDRLFGAGDDSGR
jgi:hypothetical protein